MKLDEIKSVVMPACRDFNVKRLDVFGSIAKGNATETSDLDILVEFRDPDRQPAKHFFGLLHKLEDALGCKVDLLTIRSLRNPHFRKRVLEERVPLYDET